jgi:hypothetical protein
MFMPVFHTSSFAAVAVAELLLLPELVIKKHSHLFALQLFGLDVEFLWNYDYVLVAHLCHSTHELALSHS